MSPTHQALYVDQNVHFSVRTDMPIPEPEDNELLIETLYSGINPADAKHAQLLGMVPAVIGYDFCGRVVSAPADSNFSKGDVVAGSTPTGIGRKLAYGVHQKYFVCPVDMLFKVPENLPEKDAAALTVVAMTAADVSYNIFKFSLPGESEGKEVDQSPVLIWGASASVGVLTVQYLRASGVRNIFVTASPARHELLRSLGATQCFDYKSPSAAEDIAQAVEKLGAGPILYGLDAAGAMGPTPSSVLLGKVVTDPRATLASVVPANDKRFIMPFATKNLPTRLQPPGVPHEIVMPARVEEHQISWRACMWAVSQYGRGFELPSVEVLEGSAKEALEAVLEVAEFGRGFGKQVIQHPFR